MEYLVSAEEMRRADHCVIEEYGVPSLVLMERAALASVKLMEWEGFDLSRVLVVSGSGNNGGDGFAMARILYLKGIEAELWFVGNPDHLSKEAALQKKICENYGMKFVRNLPAGEYTTIVDAVFGSGLSREVKGSYREVIESINRHPAKVFAVDIPSGISSDDGSVQGTAVRAAVTGALAFRKLGHVLYPGTEYAGRTFLLDIGITKEGFKGQFPRVQAPDRGIFSLLPTRKAFGNKGTFGKACLMAGSRNMAGAAYLSGKAAAITGTGLVRVVTEGCNREILQTLFPEAVLTTEEMLSEERLVNALSWADAAGIGPGLSTGEAAEKELACVLTQAKIPLVLDADALNILSKHPDWLKKGDTPKILTPHMGEMVRLSGHSMEELKQKPLELAAAYAKEHEVILVLKDARTVVTDGERIVLNTTGNNGMATGGSGDVLTGIITGLLAQGMAPFEAAVSGVYLHGLAGDRAAENTGVRGMLSTDLLKELPGVLKEG